MTIQIYKKIKILFVSLSLTAPFSGFARTLGDILNPTTGTIPQILNIVIPILMVIATIVFIWGIISYILSAGSDERKKEAKNLIIWGLIGLFVIGAMWGLVTVIASTFGVSETVIPGAPGGLPFPVQ